MARIKKNRISGRFVAMPHNLIDSDAFKSLSNTEKIAFLYFKRDVKSSHQKEVILTFEQAKKYGVCTSPSTFNRVKKKLVLSGFLDPYEPGGLGKCSVFSLSDRWKHYGTLNFKKVEPEIGFGSKYFRDAWKNENKKNELLNSRQKQKPNTNIV